MLMLVLGLISCTSSDKGSGSEDQSDKTMKQEQSTAEKAPANPTQDIPVGSAVFEGTVSSSLNDDQTSLTVTITDVVGYGSQMPRLTPGEKTFIVPEGALSVREKLSESAAGETHRFMALYRENMSGATWTLQEIID